MPTRKLSLLRHALIALWLALSASSLLHGQQAATDPAALLKEAKGLYDRGEYEAAIAPLGTLISALERGPLDATLRRLLVQAYGYRARARLLTAPQDHDAPLADFEALLKLDPGYTLDPGASSRARDLFAQVKNALVGAFALSVEPPDAEVLIDGELVKLAGGRLPMIAGPHRVVIRHPSFKTAEEAITVTPGASVSLRVALERASATLTILTVPAGVEILMDGNSLGATAVGPPSGQFASLVATAGVTAADVSAPLEVKDVVPGDHDFVFRKTCYETQGPSRIQTPRAADYTYPVVKLIKAVGTLQIEAPGGVVYINGQPRGPAGTFELCKGQYRVEVRTDYGRDTRQVDLDTGESIVIKANPRPAVAVLSTTGRPAGFVSGLDLRRAIEDRFAKAQTFTVFAPPIEEIRARQTAKGLDEGWLSSGGVPQSAAVQNMNASGRVQASKALAADFDVQGLVGITALSNDDLPDVYFTLLAKGSGKPDTLLVKLADSASVDRAIRQLDSSRRLFKPSAGLQAADIEDAPGALVIRLERGGPAEASGLVVGDRITQADGQAITTVAALSDLVSKKQAGDLLHLDAVDLGGVAKRAELRIVSVPEVIGLLDETLLANKLILDFRRALGSITPAEEPVARLNLGVALMRAQSWDDAKAELDQVRLPAGPGVNEGTVQYLLGVCLKNLGDPAAARAAFDRARAVDGALLTANGLPIKDLAQKEITALGGR